MINDRCKVSPSQISVWDVEMNPINTPSPPISQIANYSNWDLTPIETFSQTGTTGTNLIKESRSPQNDVTKSVYSRCKCENWRKTLAFIIALGLIIAAAIIIPIVVTKILGEPLVTTTTTTTTSTITTETTTSSSSSTTSETTTSETTSTTTTTKPICAVGCANISTSISSRLAFYSFDSNTNDTTGIYPPSGIASPTYTTGYVGSAIYFNAFLSQRLSAPSMNLNSRSFTIEFWFNLPNPTSSNYAFFGQLSVRDTTKQCLFLMSASGSPYIGFLYDDTQSPTVVQSNRWYHVAFVYDNDKRQRFIYLDGILDTSSPVGVGPYLGTSGPITIGGADIYASLGTLYFTGSMDHLTISTRVKTACEILNDATLATYLPFDGSFTDAGPNFLTATSSGASFISGIVNQAIYLSGSNSYVQISGLTGLGRANYPFSVAFWMLPITPGVLVHVHSGVLGLGWCTSFIGISPTGNIIVQLRSYSVSYNIPGPVIQFNAWTHIVQTYSPTNGQSLYINGLLYATWSNATTYDGSGSQNFITIGNLLNGASCYNPGILQTPYQGMIDELRIYSRELSSTDACLLASL